MHLLTILLVAFGLAMDAFAVAIGSGIALKKFRIIDGLRVATFFGGFQSFMPILGWAAGVSLRSFISSLDHWIAFGLLCLIGGHMIYEVFHEEPEEIEKANPMNLYVLLGLSIATSIDALAVGLSFSLVENSIAGLIIAIGCVTFILSFLGVLIGHKFGHFAEKQVEIIGGIVLIGIGIKILIEHLAVS